MATAPTRLSQLQKPTSPLSASKFHPSLDSFMKDASLIISHAGTGSILESFFLKKRLIVVPNETLMDNHQVELAVALHERKSLINASVNGIVEELLSRSGRISHQKNPATPLSLVHILEEEVGLSTKDFLVVVS
ncbi:glycosyltransferase family 28 C-terminal domain-containing protein [Chytridium lagenaria]|nr:glycosyltransferase family 28 C-terminal domain-containing protein [Chytridium lagenaria]